jgi:carbon-monoxide dehydrogenase medium subunit
MYEFNYHRPTTLEQARTLFSDAEDPSYLAGGMTLIPTLKQRLAQPSDLIDLSQIANLNVIEVGADFVQVSALTPHAAVAGSKEIAAKLPVLCTLAGLIGDGHVRNRGTIGGSVANSDPSADYPAAVVALNSTVTTTDREIAGDQFFEDLFTTALAAGELLTSVRFSLPTAAAYQKFPNPASRYAVVGVLVAKFADGVHVGVTGAGPCAYRERAMEAALNGDLSAAALKPVSVDYSAFNSDLHASAEYRGHLVKVMAMRAVNALG